MSRRGQAEKRIIQPDSRFHDVDVQRFINKIMLNGKKSVAEHIVYGAIALAEQRVRRPGLEIFQQALRNVTPVTEVRPRRVGGATYQVPIEIRADRRNSLAMRWLVRFSRARGGRSMVEKLAAELQDAVRGKVRPSVGATRCTGWRTQTAPFRTFVGKTSPPFGRGNALGAASVVSGAFSCLARMPMATRNVTATHTASPFQQSPLLFPVCLFAARGRHAQQRQPFHAGAPGGAPLDGPQILTRSDQKYRHHRAHRRWQDHGDGANSLFHRSDASHR